MSNGIITMHRDPFKILFNGVERHMRPCQHCGCVEWSMKSQFNEQAMIQCGRCPFQSYDFEVMFHPLLPDVESEMWDE